MGYITAFGQLIQYAVKGRKWDYMVIHRPSLARLPSSLTIPLLAGHVKGKLECPSEIQIVLIHNYDKMSLAEKSLRYVGINNYTVLKPEINGPWRNAEKLVILKKFLESKTSGSKYILYLDSSDVILRDEPRKALTYLREQKCDLLFSKTAFSAGYECMREVEAWTSNVAEKYGHSSSHLNSGVYIGTVDFLLEVLDSALEFVTNNDLTPKESWDLLQHGRLCEHLPDFPKAVGSDQMIMRYLYRQFYPRMKIDYPGKLALRSTMSVFNKWAV